MRFLQNTPLMGYRNNLILAALIEIDQLERLRASSSSLSNALDSFREPEVFLDLVNQLAYNAIDRLVPEMIGQLVQEELEEMPIDAGELDAVLHRPLGSALQMLYRKQA